MRFAAIAASLLTLVGLLAAVPASGAKRGVQFRVSGSVTGLYPGARRSMKVTIRNPLQRRIQVVSVTAQVGRGKRHCTGSNLDVRGFRGRVSIPPHRARVVRMAVRMPSTAAQECSGARFPLRFHAKAVAR